MTKTTHSRSLFKALDMICVQKYTSFGLHNLKIRCEEAKSIKFCGDYFIIIHTSRTKGYVHKSVRPWSLNCSIVPVFWSLFEVSFQNISPFSSWIIACEQALHLGLMQYLFWARFIWVSREIWARAARGLGRGRGRESLPPWLKNFHFHPGN